MGLVMAVLAATMIIHGMVCRLCLSSFTTRLRVEGVQGVQGGGCGEENMEDFGLQSFI
jgi:hypothetical protein